MKLKKTKRKVKVEMSQDIDSVQQAMVDCVVSAANVINKLSDIWADKHINVKEAMSFMTMIILETIKDKDSFSIIGNYVANNDGKFAFPAAVNSAVSESFTEAFQITNDKAEKLVELSVDMILHNANYVYKFIDILKSSDS